MRILYALLIIVAIIGCGSNASVEFGMNDEALFDGESGDLTMRVLSIEVPDGDTYVTLWEGPEYVPVELKASGFTSITTGYIDVEPRTISRVRVTVDSLTHVQQTSLTLVIEPAFSFIAQAFTPIVIGEEDELRLVIVINAETWFNDSTGEIIQGHDPFEDAALRIYYDYQ